MKSFTRHVFATLTYQRDRGCDTVWQTITNDFNRYHQRLRRLHRIQIEYLRVIEEHRDGYPHIHTLLQYPSACISVENSRYFDRALYSKWKAQWREGHSDYQKPRQGATGTLSYVMKYLIKNQTSKTVWKKVLASCNVQTVEDSTVNAKKKNGRNISNVTRLPTRKNGVKLCTWSRGFDFTPFVPRL